jgi:hypothetical protein
VARIDHTINESNRFFVRLLGEPSTTITAPVLPVAAADPFGVSSLNYYYNLSGTYYHSFLLQPSTRPVTRGRFAKPIRFRTERIQTSTPGLASRE